ncbi:hypothetical protein F4777DRAFT_213846 [Nemania sp. FL0916]|nr:hypothetical protein F4777DRAFT_213846 [Nemania sp. FL0916]
MNSNIVVGGKSDLPGGLRAGYLSTLVVRTFPIVYLFSTVLRKAARRSVGRVRLLVVVWAVGDAVLWGMIRLVSISGKLSTMIQLIPNAGKLPLGIGGPVIDASAHLLRRAMNQAVG